MTPRLLTVSSMANAGLHRRVLRSFFEGLVGPIAELQVSPPCVRPLLLITFTSARDLRITPSGGRVRWRIPCGGCWESSAQVYSLWASNTGQKPTASQASPGIPRRARILVHRIWGAAPTMNSVAGAGRTVTNI